jgi:hypothetical protein
MSDETNGDGRGSGSSAEARLQKRLAEHLAKVAALEMTLAMLHGTAKAKKVDRQASVIDHALALDKARRGHRKLESARRGRPPGSKSKKRATGTHTIAAITARRQHSAKLLAAFDQKPKTPTEAGLNRGEIKQLGSLFRHGYLKRKGAGWVRTSKEFTDKPGWTPTVPST